MRAESGLRDMTSLPAEILLNILTHLNPTLEIPRLDDRAWLSVESFRPPAPVDEGAASYIANFRLTCKKFSAVGVRHQFSTVVTRFSVAGFARLRNISAHPHIAKAVHKFSYMVSRVYLPDDQRILDLQNAVASEADRGSLGKFFEKAKEQVKIFQNSIDSETLEAAIASFDNLQHIRVLRMMDQLDQAFLIFLNNHRDVAEQHVELRWGPVSSRAASTLGQAVLRKEFPVSRWSFPLVDTQSAIRLMNISPRIRVSSIAASLECLSLRFEDSRDLEARLRELSPLFHTVLNSAKNLVSVHIGFPQRSVSIPLRTVFDGIVMEKLRVFSIGGWRLDAEEIIHIGYMYRNYLRGLRLHGVLLRKGGMWKDVLDVLRTEMLSLRWLSLSKADYAAHFDEHTTRSDVTEDLDRDDSESDTDRDEEDTEHNMQEQEEIQEFDNQDTSDAESLHSHEDVEVDSDVDSVNDLDPTAHAFTTQLEAPDYDHTCTCSSWIHELGKEDLEDNGMSVTQTQRKIWEKWVVGCSMHGRFNSSTSALKPR